MNSLIDGFIKWLWQVQPDESANSTECCPYYSELHRPKNRKNRSILDMCGSDTHIGTPYQSISEDDNSVEAVPLILSAPPPTTYNSVHRSSMEFHSFEDSWKPGRHNTGGRNPGFSVSPQPSSSSVNSDSNIPNTNGGEITSMAF
ncbi:Protein tweety 3 [Desmophyllum pertusum]|uniref:Protein tweety 3 n=1 Tax=Desmophyllum pertusum TaxID=174260 RepID=A0A9W9YJJ0_9CNID|nr:Protein tweety 3 [Desmophyllum pertusum]